MADLPELKFDSNSSKLPDLSFEESGVTVKENAGSHPTYGVDTPNENPILSTIRGINSGLVSTAETAGGAISKLAGASSEARKSAKEATDKFGGDFLGIKPAMPGTAASVAENAADVGVQSIPGLAMSSLAGPVAGFGAAGAIRGYAEDKNPALEAAKDALFTKLFMVAGGAGGNAFISAAKKIGIPEAEASAEFLKRSGNAVGSGAAGAITSGGDPSSVIQGTALGATFPSDKVSGGDFNPLSSKFYTGQEPTLTKEQFEKLTAKAADIHRFVLNPGSGIIKKVEIKSGKDLNDSFQRAADLGLIYDKDQNGKLDITGAIKQVSDANSPYYDEQKQILDSNKSKQFDLEKLGEVAKKNLNDGTKSASELKANRAKIDSEIEAEIERHGPSVNASKLNMIKQGLWERSYNPLEPNANDAARALGHTAKDAIEHAFPEERIKELNAEIGKNLQLRRILEASHGQVIQGGKLGKYFARISGLGVGAAAGHMAHIPGAEAAGAMLGQEVGGRVENFMNDPRRITEGLAKKLAEAKAKVNMPAPQPKAGPKSPLALEYKAPPAYLQERQNMPQADLGVKGKIPPQKGIPVPKDPYVMPGEIKSPLLMLSKLAPDYLKPREEIAPIEESGIAKRPEMMVNNTNPSVERKYFYERSEQSKSQAYAKQDASNPKIIDVKSEISPKSKAIQKKLGIVKESGEQKPTNAPLSEFNPLAKQGKGKLENNSKSGKVLGASLALGATAALGTKKADAAQEFKTIGQKNNNPINLKAFQKWDGMTGKDSFQHAQFKTLDHGIRAGLKNLKNHQAKNPAQSLTQYLKTFAQKNGDKEAAFIAKQLGVSPNASLHSISMEKMIIPLANFESKMRLTDKDILRVKQKFNME